MSSLAGRSIPQTFKDLLRIEHEGQGLDAQKRYVEDGAGKSSGLGLAENEVHLGGDGKKVFVNGSELTVTATQLNSAVANSGSSTHNHTISQISGLQDEVDRWKDDANVSHGIFRVSSTAPVAAAANTGDNALGTEGEFWMVTEA